MTHHDPFPYRALCTRTSARIKNPSIEKCGIVRHASWLDSCARRSVIRAGSALRTGCPAGIVRRALEGSDAGLIAAASELIAPNGKDQDKGKRP